jgi:hypothetical protein
MFQAVANSVISHRLHATRDLHLSDRLPNPAFDAPYVLQFVGEIGDGKMHRLPLEDARIIEGILPQILVSEEQQ